MKIMELVLFNSIIIFYTKHHTIILYLNRSFKNINHYICSYLQFIIAFYEFSQMLYVNEIIFLLII
jgi:hypothetical protein